MKDFDEARATTVPMFTGEDATFRLGGEVFTCRPAVRPEVLAAATSVTVGSTINDDVSSLDAAMYGFLDDESRVRYDQIRARDEEPITYFELVEVVRWLVEAHTTRPTQQPAPSGTGQGPTAVSLTAVSDSPPAAQAG